MRRKKTAVPRDLTRAAVVEAAARLLRQYGLDGFSMRLLGADLGVTATALYYHVGSKDALLDTVFRDALKALTSVGEGLDWAQAMEELLVQLQMLAAEYQGLWSHLADHLDSEATFQWMELMLAMLRRGGFEGEAATRAMIVLSFYNSPVSLRRRGGQAGSGVWERLPADQFGSRLESLSGAYPLVAQTLPFQQSPDEALFRQGLRSLIAGLRGLAG